MWNPGHFEMWVRKYLNFESQLLFYSQYHHQKVNKIIHIICIPTIMFTVMIAMSAYIPKYNFQNIIDIQFTYVMTSIYVIYYLLLEPVAGALYAPILLLMTHYAEKLALDGVDMKWVLIVHVAAWILQFVGHGVFEKRAPALLDSLFQAFLLAPFFVFMEVLFAMGYRPVLRTKMEELTVQAIKDYRNQKAKKQNAKK
ncbi:DUF962 domain protein [Rozella allomycis CSF55]|uniref:DUF962 domain protein n=1 Tax=Rozella allomycis (strain CSF55) TaxID=988480 RepID=A0A075B0S4_ROZAC|nr:Protein of unknown function DUF962 domain-containing protein [Rozella allomycis CSF55]RKP17198.1 DUF962 domain protein [Rozella allomycis CSF55]|eukprot:EPZ36149.1 Protein of unknown function DUF962 domain-containing protein [Rozella allomycis CSF55]